MNDDDLRKMLFDKSRISSLKNEDAIRCAAIITGSKTKLAKLVGVTPQYIWNLINGSANRPKLSMEKCLRMSKAIDKKMDARQFNDHIDWDIFNEDGHTSKNQNRQ